jgi:Uma2 family endonuclease
VELVNGEVVEMPPGNLEHGHVGMRFGGLLDAYVLAHDLGYVSGIGPATHLQSGPDVVRALDVRRQGGVDVIPDLVAEGVSPRATARQIEEKVQEWLAAGVRLVLVLYPSTQTVLAYRGPNDVRRFTAADTLDAAPVLPDFMCPVARLFE